MDGFDVLAKAPEAGMILVKKEFDRRSVVSSKKPKESDMKLASGLRRPVVTLAVSIAAATLGGCANLHKKPTGLLTQAQTVVTQANRDGTRAYAAYDLNKAHLHLREAKEAMGKDHYRRARYLASEAKVEAELAIAKTQTLKSKAAEKQVGNTVSTPGTQD